MKTQRARTKVKDVLQKAVEAKGKWAGHITQMKNREWAKKPTAWTSLYRTGAKGRPKMRWTDDIKKAGSTWIRSAQDCDEWKNMYNPSTSSGVTSGVP